MDHVESSLFIAPGTVRSSDDLEENPCEHKVPSRYVPKVSFHFRDRGRACSLGMSEHLRKIASVEGQAKPQPWRSAENRRGNVCVRGHEVSFAMSGH